MPIEEKLGTSMVERLSPWEKEVQIKSTCRDTFTNVSQLWDWKGRNFISATQLIAQSLRAASDTLSAPERFLLHELHTNFIRAGSYKAPVLYKVERLSEGQQSSVCIVRAEQHDKVLLICTISFTAFGGRNGSKIMRRSEKWQTSPTTLPEEGRDDVAALRPRQGANIEGYVLPTVDLIRSTPMTAAGEQPAATTTTPPHRISPNWMRIKGPVLASSDDRLVHLMGLLYVSDVFVLDAAARLSNIDVGFAKVPGANLKLDINVMLTLNSAIHIHEAHGWRCDEWFYVENECHVATEDGRFLVSSRIFTQDGKLVASARQEGYAVLSKGLDRAKASI